MIQLALFSLLVGAVFGLRFKVNVLLPLTVVGGALVGAGSLLAAPSTITVLSNVAVYALALQAGYVLGSVSRFTVAAARTARPAEAPGRAKVTH